MQRREQFAASRRERDSQRQRVYDAEATTPMRSDVTLPEVTDLTRYLMRVLNSRRVWSAFPFLAPGCEDELDRLPITIKDGRGCTHARGGRTQLIMPRWARSELVFLHEIAHLIHQREKDSPRHSIIDPTWRERKGYFAAHGWRYCMIYLQLVLWFMGRGPHDQLKAAFKQGRVRHRPPRSLSPEQRLALANRLRRMRGDPIALEVRRAA